MRMFALLAFLLPYIASSTTWVVGPSQTYTMPSQVSTLVNDGDTVNIEAGTYPSDVARWQADDLVLRGVGGIAHLESNGLSWGDKAIWVIQGNNNSVEWIEFSECQVPDHNGAGIRLEGLGLTVRHCHFHHNENGILCGEYHPSTVRIEYSEFGHHGFGDGFSHNLYIGNIDSLIFRYNYSHHADVGHELKSRAWVNMIEYNRFSNEADGTASREIDLPNGGQTYLIGNVVQQGLQSENSNIVGYGLEGLNNPAPHELYAVGNTMVNEKTGGSFFQVPADVYFKGYSNVLAGGGEFMSDWPTGYDTLANVHRTDIDACGFISPSTYDYRIDMSSPAHSAGYPAGVSNSGYPLVAWDEYVHPLGRIVRCQHATLDAGAFETCTATGIVEDRSRDLSIHPNPAHELLIVQLRDAAQDLEVLDPSGRIVRVWTGTGSVMRLDLSSLPMGAYTLRVRSKDRIQSTGFVRM